MMEAGHSQRFRDMVTNRSMARYQNILRNHMRKERGEKKDRWLYRTKEEREEQWAEKGAEQKKQTVSGKEDTPPSSMCRPH